MALSDKRNLPPGQRDLLRAREYKVDLDSRLNKTSVVTANDNRDGAGYYCEVCDCVIKDSMNFLDHINGENQALYYPNIILLSNIGKKHIQNLGMSMKLKKSTVEDVKARFELLKKKKQEEKKEYSLAERLKDAKEEQERMQSYTKDVSFIYLNEASYDKS